ncbi:MULTISPECIES: GntR family transcriptional regulator [Staphylococcus]|uniref:Gluconate operon transcriptional repressor n=1 Tax=Staphylococcus nepalensis TaxID=214473 RepID=A0A380GKP8_9STAP|nr:MULTISPECIES: GntR family transcriptional regulator [Staphylococcus]VDG66182.1 transcriptional regulator [Lacrimispora indolis]MBO1205572.1 GntR family transcriptional regulator [Staphylococcus nepalensis]MBO1212600.1 GntR family transcriptional regulator [Staphylococcus nepalensis]MBO1215956.1 GntR family transcriptional regulator [Staphylococcus nepalensis]MBO1221037.1 GntR family transcriptional regulator [Staphylococcus nepalensis]
MKYLYPEQWLEGVSKGEMIASEIRLRIVDGTITPDTLLTENQIAKEFNVSRSPVRDAFKLLKQDQLINLERMGADVLPFNDNEKKELYDLRIMLESFAFNKIKASNHKQIVKEMRKQLEMMKVAVKFEDAEAFTVHDMKFHEVTILASKHQYLKTFWNNLRPVMEALILLSMRERMNKKPEDFERIHHNHEVFIDAIADKDATKLRNAFHLNFDDVGEDIDSFWLK